MAHDPSLVGFADYFSAADATAASVMEDAAPELFGLHADMEFLGMRGLAAMPGAASAAAHAHGHSHSKAAMLIDDAGAGMRFLQGAEAPHHHPGGPALQAPLSLSLCRPDGAVASSLHQHLGGGSSRQQPAAWSATAALDYSAAPGQHAGAWQLRGSRYLLPAQQLLQELCSLPVPDTTKRGAKATQKQEGGGAPAASAQIQAMDALELQRLKEKLYIMLEEVDRRYRRYCEQMMALAGGFEAVAGERAAAAYTALASRTISRHFRSLRDGMVAQLQAARRALGDKDVAEVAVPGMTRGETPRLRVLDQRIRQHKALTQAGVMESHPWRPQRGLPDRAVTILRAWLFEHFLHPYPSDVDKHILARQTGLSRSQVSNWFINARVRLWKPMVEEMYVEEMKADGQDDGGGHQHSLNPNPSCSHASEADGGDNGAGAADRKPTRAQLMHDAGSLASIVNIGGGGGGGPRAGGRLENFGITDHIDFDAYEDGGGHQGGGWGASSGVSLTLGLQQHDSHDGGVNIAFGAPPPSEHHHGGGAGFLQFAAAGHGHQHQVEGGGVHHVQFGAGGIDGEAQHGGQEHYRSLNAGFHLLRDLAG